VLDEKRQRDNSSLGARSYMDTLSVEIFETDLRVHLLGSLLFFLLMEREWVREPRGDLAS
jgi:hypothetical protein